MAADFDQCSRARRCSSRRAEMVAGYWALAASVREEPMPADVRLCFAKSFASIRPGLTHAKSNRSCSFKTPSTSKGAESSTKGLPVAC